MDTTLFFLALSPNAPSFLDQMIGSRLVAILVGVAVLVALGIWEAWQLRAAASLPESTPQGEVER